MTRVIIGDRFAELGKVIGDPWRHRRSSMACRRGRIILIKVFGETFSILDLSRRSIYVGRLREIGEITRPIVVNMSLVTDRPTASLESVIDFAISRASSLSPLPGIQGLTGWPGQVHFLKSFPPVRPAGPRNGPSRLGVGVVQDVLERNADESFCREFQFPGDSGQQLELVAPGVAVFYPGGYLPDLSRTFGARLFQPRPRLLRRVLGEQQAAVAACIF